MSEEEILDEQLALKAQAGDDEAVDELLSKYRNLVNKISRRYFLVGGEIEDIVQEGMIGLYKAILHFSPQKTATFRTFAGTCIKNQIQSAIKVASSEKNKVLSSALSIADNPTFEEGDMLGFELFNELPSPDDELLKKEKIQELKSIVEKTLSPLEIKIFSLYLNGYSYNEISKLSGKSKKSIDNGLSRIKHKLSFLKKEK